MNTGSSLLSTLAGTLALACLASPAMAEESPPPEIAQPEISALAATDAALRARFKEYVGLRKNQEGMVFLTLSKGANKEEVAHLAREVWNETSGNDGKLPNFEFTQAAATPEQLKKARVLMRDVLAIEGVVFLDLDEACGCLVVGAANKEVNSRVAKFLEEHRINSRLVNIVQTPEYRFAQAALSDRLRPTMGGREIGAVVNGPIVNGTFVQVVVQLCTLGLPVYSWDMHNEGILTASHCSLGPLGENRGTNFAQGPPASDVVATETMDLELFDYKTHPECPMYRLCRFSDAVFASYSVANAGIRGRISRTLNFCVSSVAPCFLTLTRPTDDIRIAQATFGMFTDTTGLFTGMELDKVGRSSGWTRGPITNTCVDVNVKLDKSDTINPHNITMLCQTLVDTIALPGDSGAPVFENFNGYDAGDFAGILWGTNEDRTRMIFSPIDGIQKDLGTFTFNQAGLNASFASDDYFYTSNLADRLKVKVERGVVPQNQIEVVLASAPGISGTKEIILEEGWNGFGGKTTITSNGGVTGTGRLSTNLLWGGLMHFRKRIGNNNSLGMEYVSRVPIDRLAGGTRLTFTWERD